MSFKRKPPSGDVRRVRSTGKNIRGVITNKVGRLVQFESWAERALLLRLDRDLEVLDYQSQPETFIFTDETGKQRGYTPDFKVWRHDGDIEIHEVTLTKRQVRPEIRRREGAAHDICRSRGWQYLVHTEQELPQGSELANLLTLAGYRPTVYANPKVRQAAFEILDYSRGLDLVSLVSRLEKILNLSVSMVTAALCHLLWHGVLLTDFDKLLFDQGKLVPGVRVWIELKEVNDGV